MYTLQLHFSPPSQSDWPLKVGVQRIVRMANGSIAVVDSSHGSLLLAQLSLDDRGLWLQVAAGVRGIHVNARPVRRMALLRAGDAIHVEGVQLLVLGQAEGVAHAPAPVESAANEDGSLLRGVGGHHHGRSFTLQRPRIVGRGADADIDIDEPAFAVQHARIERHGARVLLRDLGSSDGSRVNGVAVRHCWLHAGDQVVFEGQHRYVLEVPNDPRHRQRLLDAGAEVEAIAEAAEPVMRRRVRRWPWLLASALLLAGVLSLLLWFGAR